MGLVFGSFANVCIHRIPKNKTSILGRSYCPKCKKKINWYDNIPLISYLILSGKCRKCKKNISIKYFVIELISALSFVFIYIYFDNFTEIFYFQIIVLILLIITFIDYKHFIIPDSLNYSLIILACLYFFIPNIELKFNENISQIVIGGLAGYLSIWLIIFLYKNLKNIEAMGLGDAKLMSAFGCFFGWQSIPVILFLSSISGLLFSFSSLLKKKSTLKTKIPFGPHIILGSVAYFVFGEKLFKLIVQ